MYFYKLTVAYDGTSFFGWQFQPGKPTVEAVFKDLIKGLFGQEKFYFLACSRTDSGVHAQGQVARLGMALYFEPQKLHYILNKVLPVGITIRAVEAVAPTFHPQRNVAYKRYVYTLFQDRPLPEFERYAWAVGKPLCAQRLQVILDCFIGMHDFRLYAKEPGDKKTVRSVDAIKVYYDDVTGKITISVQGVSFLHLMIRRIIGAAVALCVNGTDQYAAIVAKTLEQGVSDFNLMKNLPTAPPQGLCLQEICYKQERSHE